MNGYVLPETRVVKAVPFEGLAMVYLKFSLFLKTNFVAGRHESSFGPSGPEEAQHDNT